MVHGELNRCCVTIAEHACDAPWTIFFIMGIQQGFLKRAMNKEPDAHLHVDVDPLMLCSH